MTTTAVRDGDEYVINGHKIWTSYSDVADWCLVLARTDKDVPKHKGISAFIVSMHQPGIVQRPLKMISGVTKEFGQVEFDGARVPVDNMIGAPGDGWKLAMTVVSHEREPSTLGFSARYGKTVRQLASRIDGPAPEELSWAWVQTEMLRLHVRRRLSEQLDGLTHGPQGSLDKLLMTWVEQSVGHAALKTRGIGRRRDVRDLHVQPRAERDGRHQPDSEEHHRAADIGFRETEMYDMPDEIDVKADGALRIITLNRPDDLNAVNDNLHVGLAKIWEALNEDTGARAAVITGAGRAFSAGGDFNYLDELRNDEALRQKTIKHGRDLVIGMLRCRIPVVAAVNGPAVGLGCSLAALSDIVYIAETAFFADPHVQIGLVAADGGPLVWGSQISLLQAKEFALTGVRIKAQRAVELGLANHVVEDPLAEAIACAKKLIELPQQAVEATKRLMNIQLEQSVMASLDYANLAEYVSFGTADFNKIVDGLIAKDE